MLTTFRGRRCYDGGLSNFIPLPPDAQHGVRVCCFPAKQITTVYDIGISPDNFEEWPHTLQEMLSWAFEPADDQLLLELIGKGRADAKAWAAATGALQVVQPGKDLPKRADEQQEDYERLKQEKPKVDARQQAEAALTEAKAVTTKP
jgi:hypothetical protein